MKRDKDVNKRYSPCSALLLFVDVSCIIYGLVGIFIRVISWSVTFFGLGTVAVGKSSTIGVIGGADGPTAVFVTSSPWTGVIIPLLALVAGVVGIVFFLKKKMK